MIILSTWREDMVRALLAQNAKLILVIDSYDIKNRRLDETLLGQMVDVFRVKSVDSLEELALVAAEIKNSGYRVEKVFGATERGQMAAGLLADLIEVKRFSIRKAAVTRNKFLMKEECRKFGVAVAPYVLLGLKEIANLSLVRSRVHYPAVIKPVSAAGAKSTRVLKNELDLELYFSYVQKAQGELEQYLIESYVDGDEFHIDAHWEDGRPDYFTVSKYFKPVLQTVDTPCFFGSMIVSMSEDPILMDQAIRLQAEVNNALQIDSGFTHLEFFKERSTGNLIFSEVASRPAGGGVMDMVAASIDKSPYEAAVNSVSANWGQINSGTTNCRKNISLAEIRKVAWINLAPLAAGTIEQMPALDQLRAETDVISARSFKADGDYFDGKYPSWCTFLVLRAEGEEQIFKKILDLAQRYPFKMKVESLT